MRLEPDDAPQLVITPTLEPPDHWHPCPKCERQYAVEIVGQCTACDRDAERVRAREKAIKRAGLVGWHAEIEADHAAVLALLRASSGDAMRATVTRLLHRRTHCSAISITGPSGVGKTTLAVLLVKARLSSALFTRALSLVSADAHHALGRGEADLLARSRAVDLLVVDELKLPAIAGRRDVLEELIWDRVDAGMLTVVTHGFTEAEILNDWGAGTHRRLYVDAQHIQLQKRGDS